MRPQLPEHALVTLLRQCYTAPRCQLRPRRFHTYRRAISRVSCPSSSSSAQQRRGYQTEIEVSEAVGDNAVQFATLPSPGSSSETKHNIAILGGGITGLSAAHYLTRELPSAKITIYDSSDRLGGWLQSKCVNVANGKVVFESGPRTLRPNTSAGMATIEMIENLGLSDQLVVTSKDSDAARNRFVYYPDHLVRMPGPGQDLYSMAWSLLTEPVFKDFLWGAATEFAQPRRETWSSYNDPAVDDESVASFLERRLRTSETGNNMVSAVLHGIYAGDITKLSARSLLSKPWYYEALHGSVTKALIENLTTQTRPEEYEEALLGQEMFGLISQPLKDEMRNASVYTFKEGIGTLSKALETTLRANENIIFKTGESEKVKSVDFDAQSNAVTVKTTENIPSPKYSNVISTLYGRTLSSIANIPSLASMHAVTVMVVNLYFPDPNLLPERGFGYLIPRSIPYEQNPEFALGVVFDSDATVGQDDVPGTKVTVMLGGHWWDDFGAYPTPEEGVAMARMVLFRHLGVDAKPTKTNVALQKDCIPQYVVGHEARLKKAHGEIMQKFKGSLKVAGNSFTGVGLNDCVRAAREVVVKIRDGKEGCSGLERFATNHVWASAQAKR